MASKSLRLFRQSALSYRQPYICPRCRFYATAAGAEEAAPPASPLLQKLRTDLKTAMRAKDTNRLNVLRALLAEITNAAKTPNPITTDMQLLSLIRKRSAAAKDAGKEFAAAGRPDLVEREQAQVKVLEEYAGNVETMSEADVKAAVVKVVEAVKAAAEKVNMGDVLKKLLGPGGVLEGKPVERSEVARIVKQTLS